MPTSLVDVESQIGLGLDLFQHFEYCVLRQVDLEWLQIDFAVANSADNGPETTIFDPSDWLHNPEVLTRVLVLRN